jgi:hypothetical protein
MQDKVFFAKEDRALKMSGARIVEVVNVPDKIAAIPRQLVFEQGVIIRSENDFDLGKRAKTV